MWHHHQCTSNQGRALCSGNFHNIDWLPSNDPELILVETQHDATCISDQSWFHRLLYFTKKKIISQVNVQAIFWIHNFVLKIVKCKASFSSESETKRNLVIIYCSLVKYWILLNISSKLIYKLETMAKRCYLDDVSSSEKVEVPIFQST